MWNSTYAIPFFPTTTVKSSLNNRVFTLECFDGPLFTIGFRLAVRFLGLQVFGNDKFLVQNGKVYTAPAYTDRN